MSYKCIAYTDKGEICGEPAFITDPMRGGMVCSLHAPVTQPKGIMMSDIPKQEGCKCNAPNIILVHALDGLRAFCKTCKKELTERLTVYSVENRKLQNAYAIRLCRELSKDILLTEEQFEWLEGWLRERKPSD